MSIKISTTASPTIKVRVGQAAATKIVASSSLTSGNLSSINDINTGGRGVSNSGPGQSNPTFTGSPTANSILMYNTNTNQYVGLNLAYGMYTAGNQATMIGEKSYSSSTSIDSAPVPLELFIAPGEGFQINASGASSYIIKGYTFVVIPETN